MSIVRKLTTAEADMLAKEQLVIQAGEATHYLAIRLSEINEKFWSLPTERLLAVLNADVPITLATFSANTILGMAVNASLEALADVTNERGEPMFPSRAPVVPGRLDIVFDGEKFAHVAPVEETPVEP